MSGWFKVHRELFESDIWNDVTTCRLFLFLIGNASHTDGLKHKGITLNRGQYVRSYRKLADDLAYKEGRGFKKYSISTIKRSVEKLIGSERVNVKETELGTLFTVVNYALYQGLDEEEKRSPNGKNEEHGTNAELMRNEVGTNAEQEQELKNLRIKELGISSTSDEEFAAVMNFYSSNLQKGLSESPYNHELLIQWHEEWGAELLLSAMKVAAKQEAKGVAFLEGVLKNWKQAGVASIEDARRCEKEFKNHSKKSFKSNVVQMNKRESQYDQHNYGF